jgi:hypothetical protein
MARSLLRGRSPGHARGGVVRANPGCGISRSGLPTGPGPAYCSAVDRDEAAPDQDETPEPPDASVPGGPPAAPDAPPVPPPAPGWIRPDPSAEAGPQLNLGLVVGRTFDTLGREWSLFLALALPAGIGGVISGVLSPSMLTVLREGGSTTDGQVGSLILQSFVAILTGITTLATIVAADGLWRGSAIGLGEAVGRAVAVAPRAIALFVVVLVATVGLTLFLTLTVVVLQGMAPAAGAVGALLALAILIAVIYVSARLSLLLPVLVLEDTKVVGSIRRAWRLSRGHAVMLFVIALVIALCGILPSWGGLLFDMFVDNRLIAGVALGLGAMVVAPLAGIWTVIAWGILAGAPFRDSDVMTTGRGRSVGFLLVATVGLVLVMAGAGLAATGTNELMELTQGI